MKPALRTLALLAPFLAAATARGAVSMSFSGGNGSPLGITIVEPVVYVVTDSYSGGAPLFIFEDTGNYGLSVIGYSGNVTFSVNGGPGQGFFMTSAGYGTPADVGPQDMYLQSLANVTLVPGDVVTLSAGTLVSNAAYAGAIPSGTSYETFLAISTTGVKISSQGAVPEPSAAALLGLGALGFALRRKRA